MSWDVVIFSPKLEVTTKTIRDAFHQITAGQDVPWKASGDFDGIVDRLDHEFPLINQGEDGSPWVKGSSKGDGYLFLKVVYSRINEIKGLLEEAHGIENMIIFDISKDKITQGGQCLASNEPSAGVHQLSFWRRLLLGKS